MTRIIVAHRPETIRTADRVIALRDGCVDRFPDDTIDAEVIETRHEGRLREIAGGRAGSRSRRPSSDSTAGGRPRRREP